MFVLLSLITNPRVNEIDFRDKSIRKPYKAKETFKISSVTFVSLAFPLSIQFYCFRHMNIDIENEIQFYILFLTNFIFTSAIVENFKNVVGRLRPDFIARCIPIEGICTGNIGRIKEGRKSFPSGHTATSTSGFLFLIIFLNTYYLRGPVEGESKVNIYKLLLNLMLLIVPLSVGYSRFYDNRHFPSDILSGGLIALTSTLLLYKLFGLKLLKMS